MKLIKSSIENIEVINPHNGNPMSSDINVLLNLIYAHIALIGSSNTETSTHSASQFVAMLKETKNYNLLAHGTVYLKIPYQSWRYYNKYKLNTQCVSNSVPNNKFGRHGQVGPDEEGEDWYITTTYKEIIINGWEDDLQYICEPTENHEKRYTKKFIGDSNSLQKLGQYNGFTKTYKNDIENEITYIIPNWVDIPEGNFVVYDDGGYWITTDEDDDIFDCGVTGANFWLASLIKAEQMYYALINTAKWTPEQAIQVLPKSLKTELIMTGFESQWEPQLIKTMLLDGKK